VFKQPGSYKYLLWFRFGAIPEATNRIVYLANKTNAQLSSARSHKTNYLTDSSYCYCAVAYVRKYWVKKKVMCNQSVVSIGDQQAVTCDFCATFKPVDAVSFVFWQLDSRNLHQYLPCLWLWQVGHKRRMYHAYFSVEYEYRNFMVVHAVRNLRSYLLTPRCRIFFEKRIVTQLVIQQPAFFMEPDGALPCSQKPATGPYPEPAKSSSPHRSLVSVTFILMLSSYLRLGLPSSLFTSGLPTKTL
jgi:hypothetical protein